MAAYVWARKPRMSPAEVQSRFGPGTSLVRMGDGRWTLRAAGGGAYRTPTLTPPPARGPTNDTPPPPPPIAPPPTFTNPALEARLASLGNRLLAIPGTYNARRAGVFIQGQQALADRGLTDVYRDAQGNLVRFTTQVAPLGEQSPGGSQQYQLTGGSEGQAFRDARTNIAANHGARGAYFGSARADDQRRAQAGLTDARAAVQRNMANAQTDLNQGEVGAVAEATSGMGQIKGDIANWTSDQIRQWTADQIAGGSQVTAPSLAATPPAASVSPVSILPGTGEPKIVGPAGSAPPASAVRPVWKSKPKYTPQQIQSRFGAGAKLVKSGSGKWTVKGV